MVLKQRKRKRLLRNMNWLKIYNADIETQTKIVF